MKKLTIIFCLLIALVSCNSSKKIMYLQDVKVATPEKISSDQAITIQPKDMISIIVSSKDPELAAMFNLPIISNYAGIPKATSGITKTLGYVVDNNGDINFPIIGKIQMLIYPHETGALMKPVTKDKVYRQTGMFGWAGLMPYDT